MLSLAPLVTMCRLASDPNFTRTAEALNLTQPAVTQQVRVLQDHFATKLVDVIGKRTFLTDAGRFLVDRSTVILGLIDALERDMRDFAEARSGDLRIGATVTIGSYALPQLLARFLQRYPDVRVGVTVENTRKIVEQLKAGALSLALIEGPLDDPDLEVHPFADDELIIIAPVGHRFAQKRAQFEPRDLQGERFIAREDGSGTRVLFEETLRRAGVEPIIALALPTGEGIVRAVQAGMGIAAISRLVAEPAIAAGFVAATRFTGLTFARTFRSARLAHRTPSPAAKALQTMLETR
jgi:DNA-binding transcriptional LysR family regulator